MGAFLLDPGQVSKKENKDAVVMIIENDIAGDAKTKVLLLRISDLPAWPLGLDGLFDSDNDGGRYITDNAQFV